MRVLIICATFWSQLPLALEAVLGTIKPQS